MKIVIDIPEDVLKRTVFYREFKDLNDCITTIKALEKAVPLPKGHGNLKDADALMKEAVIISNENESYSFVYAENIADAPTIIEAEEE